MARIYPRGRIWWCAYTGWDGQLRQESTRVRDREIAMQIALRRELRHAMAREGYLDPAEIEFGEKGQAPIAQELKKWTARLPDTPTGRDNAVLLNAFITEQRITRIAEYGSRSIIARVEAHLAEVAKKDVSKRRVNDSLRQIRAFGEYLWKQGLIEENRTLRASLPRIAPSAGVRTAHRALSPIELELLARHAHRGRGLFYLFRALTGIRGSEAVKLDRADLDLGGEPTVRIRPEIAKNGMGCTLPLPKILSRELRRVAGMKTGRLFANVATSRNSRKASLKVDLRAAGIKSGADEINARSFRKTHNTWARLAELDGEIIGTLRRDRGSGTALLRRWNYSDESQLMPALREAAESIAGVYITGCRRARHEQRRAAG